MTRHSLIALILPFLGLPLSAEDSLRISGFGTLGGVYVDSKYYGYRKDVSYKDGVFDGEFDLKANSVLGIQFDYQLNSEWDLSYQAVYRGQHDLTLDSASNLAFIRYKPSANWTVRTGRIGFDLFQLTEYRDIGFAYPWAKTPSEVYGIIGTRSLDGFDASFTHPIGETTFNLKFSAGKSDTVTVGYETQEVETITLNDIYNITLGLETFDWYIKAKHTEVEFDNNIELLDQLIGALNTIPSIVWPDAETLANGIGLEGTSAKYSSLSASYTFGNFVASGELSKISGKSLLVRDLNNGYISTSYLLNDHTLYMTFGKTSADEYQLGTNVIITLPPDLQPLAFGVNTALSFLSSNQRSYSVGWRWNFDEQMAFKLQWERTKIEENGGTLWRRKDNVIGLPEDTVNALFINLDFIF
ncbi:hypothetical protein [Pleionea sediminis]|uniref:hypothetical protein n=1 Tax=Pleionea sediminis TaxID=2569479 RepID=UPI001184C4CD|nr:hypothetical protein [Pleionea sediminis]